MKTLVTGGSGFVGAHVVAGLRAAGHEVVVFDQHQPTGTMPYIAGDLTNLDDVLRATEGVEGICHLGGVGDVYLALAQPHTAAAANVLGTANVMEAALRNGVGKVVYASTWEVYGRPDYQPLDEQHPCRPDHPYNITKLAGEQMALAYDRLKNVPTIALRLGTVYGRGMRPNSVFAVFIRRAMNHEDIIIKGTGQQARQFTHTSDIARAFVLALAANLRAEVFNIVAPESITIGQLAAKVAARFPVRIGYDDARAGDIAPARVSAAKAWQALGWQAQMPFDEGLADLIASYR